MARAISKILFILGLYNFLACLECVRSYAWSKGHSDPDLSSVYWDLETCRKSKKNNFFFFILAISKLKDQKSSSGGEIYRVIGRSENGKRAFKFDCPIKKHFPLIQSNDKRFLAILGYDKAKNKDAVMVYHSQKGVFLHKVILK